MSKFRRLRAIWTVGKLSINYWFLMTSSFTVHQKANVGQCSKSVADIEFYDKNLNFDSKSQRTRTILILPRLCRGSGYTLFLLLFFWPFGLSFQDNCIQILVSKPILFFVLSFTLYHSIVQRIRFRIDCVTVLMLLFKIWIFRKKIEFPVEIWIYRQKRRRSQPQSNTFLMWVLLLSDMRGERVLNHMVC